MTPDSRPEIMVTAIGPHREGLVGQITSKIASWGGHIVQSRSMELGLQKVFVALVWTGDRQKANMLRLNLNDMADNMTVTCMWVPDTEKEMGVEYVTHKLLVRGQQRLGLLHQFHEALLEKGVQIAHMDFDTNTSKENKTYFTWDMTLEVPKDVEIEDVRRTLHETTLELEKYQIECDLQ
eukprot:CAMPEP_0197853230 /NCGR_PEP_ID=MMETSP1438-20131217/22342_1 /TAXON_ID=1461541 /ORGANISM="Pterosperma sp., Strain CCMP1384" /LENGTH=179 /DNA_ID=CAMNT_0043467561 /DNA_START=296 /DNA_END=835 /DNA_ORIENTATION=+